MSITHDALDLTIHTRDLPQEMFNFTVQEPPGHAPPQKKFKLATARQRSWEGNVFTGVCLPGRVGIPDPTSLLGGGCPGLMPLWFTHPLDIPNPTSTDI